MWSLACVFARMLRLNLCKCVSVLSVSCFFGTLNFFFMSLFLCLHMLFCLCAVTKKSILVLMNFPFIRCLRIVWAAFLLYPYVLRTRVYVLFELSWIFFVFIHLCMCLSLLPSYIGLPCIGLTWIRLPCIVFIVIAVAVTAQSLRVRVWIFVFAVVFAPFED